MSPVTAQQVVESLRRLPPLPALAIQILAQLGDERQASLRQLCSTISHDPAIAARVLRVANSPFFGRQGCIATLEDATMMLGTQAVRSLVAAACLVGTFRKAAAGGFSQRAFWEHSIGVAVIARELAPRASLDPSTAFAAGLLHDVGRLVLAAGFPDRYAEVLKALAESQRQPVEAERALLGIDHQEAGALLAREWKFAAILAEAIGNHHADDESAIHPAGILVHASDVLAHALRFGAGAGDLVPPVSLAAWARLNIDWNDMPGLLRGFEVQHEVALGLLAA